MSSRRIGSVALVAALLIGAGWLWQRRADLPLPLETDMTVTSRATVAAATRTEPRSPHPETSATATDPIPVLRARWQRSSLRGAGLDGQIRMGTEGRLQFDPELRRRFEHYLALTGEFSLDELRLLLFEDVNRLHGAQVAAIVADAFDRYLGLRQALADADLPDSAAERFARVQQLRRDWFGADADTLFRDETDYDAFTVMRLALENDARLDPDQRAQLQTELDATRPAAERAAREVSTTAQLAQEHTRQLDARQADVATRHAERSALWGEPAATRLANLDRQHDAWEQRVQTYAGARARLLGDTRLDPGARQRALDELLSASFAGTERLRIESLQAVDALPDGG